jgi:ABC-2 type transport system permease protein
VAAHVLRLRAALLIGALRGERRVRALVMLVIVALITAVVCAAVLSLDDAPVAVARTVIVLGSAALLLGFLVGPVLVGATDQLDPRRFAVFGVDERQMPWILVLASFVSVPSAAVIAVYVSVCIVAVRLGTPWQIAVLMSVLGVLSTLLAARISMALNALLLPERRSRELTAIFALAVIVIAFPVAVFLASLKWDGEVPAAVAALTSTIGLTPLAAPSWFLFAVATDGAGAWIGGVIAVATVVLFLALWTWLVRRLLTTTERPLASRERSGLGWFGLLPSNAFGAIAARSLVYWLRDRRYIMNLIVVPVAGALTVLPLLVAGVPLEIAALVPVPVMALFFGWLPHNDVAYDSTALWTHVASGVRGVPDRLGRLVPVVLVSVPVLAIAVDRRLAPVAAAHGSRRKPPAVGARVLQRGLRARAVRGVASGRQPVPAAAASDVTWCLRSRSGLPRCSPGQHPHRMAAGSDHGGRLRIRVRDVLGGACDRARRRGDRRRGRRTHLRARRREADGVRRDRLTTAPSCRYAARLSA